MYLVNLPLGCCLSILIALQVIHEKADPLEVLASSMSRPLKPEISPLVAEAAQHAHYESLGH
jgi:hypothetical protein